MGENEQVDPNLGMNRRQLIRRGALLGGAVAWAAPVVQSFTSPAFAQVGTPPSTDCPPENLRVGSIVFDMGGTVWEVLPFEKANCLGPPPPGNCAAINQYVADLFNAAGIVPVGDQDVQVCLTALPDPECLVVRAGAAKTGGGSTSCIGPDNGGLSLPICFTAHMPHRRIVNVQISVECCIPADVIAQCP